MKHPRFSIATFMAAVLVLAVNLAAGDFYFGGYGSQWVDLINFGVRPMASILAVGLLPLARSYAGRDNRRHFFAGFEVAGAGALFLYIACASVLTQSIHDSVGSQMDRFVSRATPLFPWGLLGLFLMPQLLVAWLGGWLNTHYRFRLAFHVERRKQT